MKLADYLGAHSSELLASEPFSAWAFRRTVESELPEIEVWYEFDGRGVEVICDEDERIQTIFLHAGGEESLSDVPFRLSRRQVRELFGPPSASGGPVRHAVLGESGAWDRFSSATRTIHIQYRVDADKIELVTLIRPDAIP